MGNEQSPTERAADAAAEHAGHGSIDARLVLLVAELFRHSKAIGASGAGTAVLDVAGTTGTGVIRDDDPQVVLGQLQDLLGSHRVWDRFPPAATTSSV